MDFYRELGTQEKIIFLIGVVVSVMIIINQIRAGIYAKKIFKLLEEINKKKIDLPKKED